MASAARRARRAQKPIMMSLESIVQELNGVVGKLDNYAQQVSQEGTANPAIIARLTQGIVLGGTATEILSGLSQSLKMMEAAQAAQEETTEEETCSTDCEDGSCAGCTEETPDA